MADPKKSDIIDYNGRACVDIKIEGESNLVALSPNRREAARIQTQLIVEAGSLEHLRTTRGLVEELRWRCMVEGAASLGEAVEGDVAEEDRRRWFDNAKPETLEDLSFHGAILDIWVANARWMVLHQRGPHADIGELPEATPGLDAAIRAFFVASEEVGRGNV